MNSIHQRYATPFITGLFLVSLISGIALFFHFGSNYFRGMHEWLSMVLIVPFILHLWKNWRPMTVYFKKPAFAVAMLASLIGAVAFAYPALTSTGSAGGPPQLAFFRAVLANPVSQVAPLIGHTPESLVKQLQTAGFTIAAADMKLSDIVTRSGKNEFELAAALKVLKP